MGIANGVAGCQGVEILITIKAMKLPYVIAGDLAPEYGKRWEVQFKKTKREVMEGLWRRTQLEYNREYSGWKSEADARRKMIHFMDRYDVVENKKGTVDFVLKAPYMWMHFLNPKNEIDRYREKLLHALRKGGWKADGVSGSEGHFVKGDLSLQYVVSDRQHVEGIKNGRKFPSNYNAMEVTVSSKYSHVSDEQKKHPWDVLNSGLRIRDKRGEPEYSSDIEHIRKLFPMQLELGCGPSIEAGIPPLYRLHDFYFLNNHETGKFFLDPEDDHLFEQSIADIEAFYMQKASLVYASSLLADVTPFYAMVKKFFEHGLFVGPVITNNFDGMCAKMGIDEKYVRRFDEAHIAPDIRFDPAAKALLVVGSHADRRKIQDAARKRGLQVVYVDPESFREGGKNRPYPLESVCDGDIVFPMTAGDFSKEMGKLLK